MDFTPFFYLLPPQKEQRATNLLNGEPRSGLQQRPWLYPGQQYNGDLNHQRDETRRLQTCRLLPRSFMKGELLSGYLFLTESFVSFSGAEDITVPWAVFKGHRWRIDPWFSIFYPQCNFRGQVFWWIMAHVLLRCIRAYHSGAQYVQISRFVCMPLYVWMFLSDCVYVLSNVRFIWCQQYYFSSLYLLPQEMF